MQIRTVALRHLPHRGVAPTIDDALGGQSPIVFTSLNSALPHFKIGKLRDLAVSGEKRWPALPEVPATAGSVLRYDGAATPDQFPALLQTDVARWARIVESSRAAVD